MFTTQYCPGLITTFVCFSFLIAPLPRFHIYVFSCITFVFVKLTSDRLVVKDFLNLI